jgi:hypothetical protein
MIDTTFDPLKSRWTVLLSYNIGDGSLCIEVPLVTGTATILLLRLFDNPLHLRSCQGFLAMAFWTIS